MHKPFGGSMNDLIRAFENDRNILIVGQTGVGKSVFAKELHNKSIFHSRQFVHLNVTSLSKNLIESELFGHSKGSFTSATSDKIGFAQTVGDGTLFIDEIGSLSLDSQAKLLTLIEERIYYPVGCVTPKHFRGKLIFATNENLQQLVKRGSFREDLFYRMSGFVKHIPPLKEILTKEKAKALIHEKQKSYSQIKVFEESAIEELLKMPWKGNYREFFNCIDNLIFSSEQRNVTGKKVRQWYENLYGNEIDSCEIFTTYKELMEQYERELISSGLKKNLGRVNQTSRYLQLNKTTLIAKMKKYAINSDNFNFAHS